IIDVTKSLVRASSRMELETAHWNRMAFLCCCLHIFLIGTDNLKNLSLNICFIPHLISMLKADLQRKLECEVGVSLKDMVEKGLTEKSIIATEVALRSASNGESSSEAIRNGAAGPTSSMDEEKDSDVDAEGIPNENIKGINDLSEICAF
ncbi:hypothetical protein EV363DRAFT_1165852, partial [Boletus edulis]